MGTYHLPDVWYITAIKDCGLSDVWLVEMNDLICLNAV